MSLSLILKTSSVWWWLASDRRCLLKVPHLTSDFALHLTVLFHFSFSFLSFSCLISSLVSCSWFYFVCVCSVPLVKNLCLRIVPSRLMFGLFHWSLDCWYVFGTWLVLFWTLISFFRYNKLTTTSKYPFEKGTDSACICTLVQRLSLISFFWQIILRGKLTN